MAENKDNQDLGDSLPDGDRGLGDLLGAFMGASGGSGGDSADMLGSLMGGLMGSGDASAGGMEDLLGGLMGGATPTGGTTSSPSSSSTGGLDLMPCWDRPVPRRAVALPCPAPVDWGIY
ncbi:MAG: hypothetical protein R3C44_01860 [Chloroflexota bacterium]